MANIIARGAESEQDCRARLRTVPPVSTVTEAVEDTIPASGDPYVTLDDLRVGGPERVAEKLLSLPRGAMCAAFSWISTTP